MVVDLLDPNIMTLLFGDVKIIYICEVQKNGSLLFIKLNWT